MKTRPSTQYFGTFAFWLFPMVALLSGVTAVRGQSALDGFDPNANGTIRAVVVQPDGKILIAGDFTSLMPNGGVSVTRNHIARLNPDGTLDTNFNPTANGEVNAIAVQADGKILVGGAFTSIGGQTRTNIARLDATNGTADSFDPNANGTINAIAVQTDGKILIGGTFTSIGGQTRTNIARLDATNGTADSFNPNANNSVYAIAVQPDGNILVAGAFSGTNSIGGQTRNYIARLDATTGLADSFDPNASSTVNAIALQADGKILVGGYFNGANSIGGQPRNYIARLDATTGLADSFDPNASTVVQSIVVQADGKILAGGGFTTIGGQTRNGIARLDAATGLADAFDPTANGTVYVIAVQPDGKILAGGSFTTLATGGGPAVARNHIARLETDGRLDQTLDLSISGGAWAYVEAIAVQPDGKILIGGSFDTVLSVTRHNIARLNTDGTLDTAFDPNASSEVYAIAVQPDGKILVGGGYFGSIGGQTRLGIARLDATTGLADSFNTNGNSLVTSIIVQADGKILVGTSSGVARLDATTGQADSFNPNADGPVFSVAVQPDGEILAGGSFNSIGGQTRNNIARLDATTGLADSFDPNANQAVNAIVVQADGKILVGGLFGGWLGGGNSIGGATRNGMARLDATTGLADSFDPNVNGAVLSIAVQADGKVLAVGPFSGTNSIGGQTRNHIARLDAATGLADSYDPNAAGYTYAIGMQADGKVFMGGIFTNIGGQTRNVFARLSNDTAALQNLAATQNAVTWTLGGSCPQFMRVAFESSTDNVNYTPLGDGTAVGSNWTLTGLNLPTGQNIYIRARSYYRSGYNDGSESISESVRNVFLTLPTPSPRLNIQRTATTNVVLSWGTNFTGFTLELNTNLATNIWSTVSPDPAVSGTNNVVTNNVSGSARFYRLRK